MSAEQADLVVFYGLTIFCALGALMFPLAG
jgi:hypothetical protein